MTYFGCDFFEDFPKTTRFLEKYNGATIFFYEKKILGNISNNYSQSKLPEDRLLRNLESYLY
jgi:hypothetical protein